MYNSVYREHLLKEPYHKYSIDFEKELNEEQLKVVLSQGGPCLVIAGADRKSVV